MYLNTLREVDVENLVKNIDLKYILRCILKLSITDVTVYHTLLNNNGNDPLTVSEISTAIKKSRSTVEKSLMKLIQLGLVARRAVLTRRGGYTYVYYALPIDHVKQRLLQLVNSYYDIAKELIESTTSSVMIKSIEESSLSGE
ncbi:helix-turn-helix domain-containing protein [Caldivirga maquilingensis]|uniref:Transcriptional regulator, TrmB n=1 Tax=Caldivirga maquilingensis (strain ATCC 700844 / DSM 13496 / JCM 10307 / IC-167) TaxID=397948 RepID=A8MA64_CALMQ|nr:helix-turn-helix domain-containing protein [Caldivirga maquilingensis]ABW00996.1 transcriptional regulator, TrmB [Caldivirga maquilingensis IC-167]